MLHKAFSQLAVWLEQLFAPAHDPRLIFTPTFQHQRDALSRVQKALAEIAVSKDHLQTMVASVKGKLPQLEGQAREALRADNEHLARLVLERHTVATAELTMLEKQVSEILQEEQQLLLTEQRLSTQIDAFFTQQEIVATRYGLAEAQIRVEEALDAVSQEIIALGVVVQVAGEKAERMQVHANEIDYLIEDGLSHTSFHPVSQAVEERLELLKREIGSQS